MEYPGYTVAVPRQCAQGVQGCSPTLRPKKKNGDMFIMQKKKIHELLLSLGIGRQYSGHSITVQAVQMVIEDEDRLLRLKQSIYQPLAAQRSCDWRTIERNIRTVIHRAWRMNAEGLSSLAIYPLQSAPTVTEFLDILSVYIAHHPSLRAYR